jgi:hypothetical protein
MAEEKSLNRGGTGGQESELDQKRLQKTTESKLDRDREKQQGGIGREPGLNPNSQRQEKHISD